MSSKPGMDWRRRLARIEPELNTSKLRQELSARRLGIIFVIATLFIQVFVVFNPPEQTFSSSGGDIIPGGVSSVDQVIRIYDEDHSNDFRAILNYLGITRDEIKKMSNPQRICSRKDEEIARSSRQHLFSSNEGEITYNIQSNGENKTLYSIPLSLLGANVCYKGLVGQSSRLGSFTIVAESGDIQFKQKYLAPSAHFTNATCRAVQGYASDPRRPEQSVKVYIFVGGRPGIGKPFGPIVADKAMAGLPKGHGFTFAVPDELKDDSSIWGAMQPLTGWVGPMVQFDEPIALDKGCAQPPTPVATCENVDISTITRNQFRLSISAQAQQGALIQGYHYSVTDTKNRVVIDKKYTTTSRQFTSENFILSAPGTYAIKVTAITNIGDQTSASCARSLSVASDKECQYGSHLPASDTHCKPCPYNSHIWTDDADCTSRIILSKKVSNLTRGIDDATNTTAGVDDRLEYDLFTTNLEQEPVSTTIKENLGNVLDYATIIDNNGILNNDTKTISWGNVKLLPAQTDTRRSIVQVNNIASTPRGANNPSSNSCTLINSYGNSTRIKLNCPLERRIGDIIQQLPVLGQKENLIFGSGLLLLAYYLYLRTRQLTKESRLASEVAFAVGKNILTPSVWRAMYLDLSVYERTFGNFIHQKHVDALSSMLSTTLARPNAIIFGCASAFFGVISFYGLGKLTGTSLSGSETIVTFAVGWVAGELFDFIKAITKPRRVS